MSRGGEVLVRCLEAQGVDRVFCVPGESYLAALDALHDSPIEVVVCRHEGGAAMMAEADGKLTGRPGIAFCTRGPGATNAASGVHVAQQDSTPMLLLVGQIGRDMGGRDAFQEVDFRQMFGGMAKWVDEIRDPARIPEIVSHAYHVAMSGRPGPVVLALPEDMLRAASEAEPGPRVEVSAPHPSTQDLRRLGELLEAAQRPFAVVGGSRWTATAVEDLQEFAASWDLPVGCSFRRQMLFDHLHPAYAGDVALGINPKLRQRLAEADLLLLLGGRFSEVPSQGFSMLGIPDPAVPVVHVHPGAEELGRIYRPALAINATPGALLAAAPRGPGGGSRIKLAHADYLEWSTPRPDHGELQFGEIVRWLRDHLPEDTVITNGAGNYSIWLHRFFRYRRFGTQLAPVSGSMGYGLPAAIAAGLRHRDRPVVCLAGDGCFQMTGQEFATAVQYRVPLVVVLWDNGMYGTIRMHQSRAYPGRVTATSLVNPDFAALARACGGFGETVTDTAGFVTAFERAVVSGLPALIHLKPDPALVAPGRVLTDG